MCVSALWTSVSEKWASILQLEARWAEQLMMLRRLLITRARVARLFIAIADHYSPLYQPNHLFLPLHQTFALGRVIKSVSFQSQVFLRPLFQLQKASIDWHPGRAPFRWMHGDGDITRARFN
jgi:hypothetical protein